MRPTLASRGFPRCVAPPVSRMSPRAWRRRRRQLSKILKATTADFDLRARRLMVVSMGNPTVSFARSLSPSARASGRRGRLAYRLPARVALAARELVEGDDGREVRQHEVVRQRE